MTMESGFTELKMMVESGFTKLNITMETYTFLSLFFSMLSADSAAVLGFGAKILIK